ncbi:MAG: MFS transporter [Burkholderiaceae bacterium]|jgi:DHA2 family multidrug resistance protein-like MFS transporter|nr:MFS transporter [Burkholderiaceae bacterium]
MKPHDGLPPPQRKLAMLVILLGVFVSALDVSIVPLALPDIARQFQAPAAQSIWVVNAYQLATLAMLLPLAALGDRIGYRRVYLTGMALFTLASFGAILAPSLPLLTAARVLQGLGAAGVMSVNAALVRLTYPASQLGRGMAINSAMVAIASVSGPSLAALILSVARWPWLFSLHLPVGLLVLALGRRALPTHTASSAAAVPPLLDVALNIAVFSLIFVGANALGVRQGGAPAGHAPAWALLAAGVLLGAIYIRRQLPLAAPMFPVDLLRIPVFALSMGTSLGAFSAQMLAFITLPFLLFGSLGRSHGEAGLLLSAWPVATVVMTPLVGRLIGRYPDGLLGSLGLLLLACGLASLALLPVNASNPDIVWRLALCGVGFALNQSPNNHTIITSAPPQRSGAASGMLGTARLTGQTLGAVMLAAIFSFWNPHQHQGPTAALWIAAACAAIGAVLSSLRLPGRQKHGNSAA